MIKSPDLSAHNTPKPYWPQAVLLRTGGRRLYLQAAYTPASVAVLESWMAPPANGDDGDTKNC